MAQSGLARLHGVQEVGGSNPLAPTGHPLVALIPLYKSTEVHEKEFYYEPEGSSIDLSKGSGRLPFEPPRPGIPQSGALTR